jgi:hypothetical protein
MNNIIIQLKNKSYYEHIIITIVLILSFIVRLYGIDNPIADWHSWRQADTSSVSSEFARNGVDLLYPRYHDISTIQSGLFNPEGYRFVEFPIFNAIHALISKISNILSFVVWGRLVTVSASIISAYFLYLIVKKYLGPAGGILSAFFFGLLPYNIYYSRVILPEPTAIVCALASLYLFIKYIDDDSFIKLIVSAVLMSLSILIKPFTLFYAIPMVYLLYRKNGLVGSLRRKELYLFALIVAAPFLLWRNWISRFPEGIPFYKWVFNGDGIRFKPAFFRWIFAERFGMLILGVWGLIPLTFGIINTKKNTAIINVLLLSAVFYVSLVAEANVRHDYYQLVTVPVFAIALAHGTITMWKSDIYNKFATRALLFFSITIMFIVGAQQIKEYYKINHPEIIEAGIATDKLTENDALIIAPYFGDTAFLYQTNRWGWPYKDREIRT